MTETLSHNPSGGNADFSDRLSELMRNAGKEATPEADPAAEWSATPDELPAVSEAAESESYSIPESNEESPIFAQLKAEQAGSVETTSSQSNVDQSASRIGNLLRGTAAVADATSEKLSDGKEFAKSKLRSFGRAALRAARASRELSAGARVLATQTARGGAEQVRTAVKQRAEAVGEKVKDTYNGAIDKGMESLDKGADYLGDKVTNLKEGVKEKLVARKEAAMARRQARRERWSQRWSSTKESVKNSYDKAGDSLMNGFAKLENGADAVGDKMISAKDKVTDKVERTRSTAASLRAIGRVAIDSRRS